MVWASTEEANTIANYEAYLEEYPKGEYASEAKQRIENMVWASTEEASTIANYEAYLEAYPKSVYASETKKRIKDMVWASTEKASTAVSAGLGFDGKGFDGGQRISASPAVPFPLILLAKACM